MSEKVALSLGDAAARNVRRWRTLRGLDQQGLADRLGELGWAVDRTTVTRIEKGKRKVTVDDLGLLAVALNVPLTLLVLPVHGDHLVTLTPERETSTVHAWLLWEWMLGNEPLPGRFPFAEPTATGVGFVDRFGGEWRSGAEPLWLYERVRVAQLHLARLSRERVGSGDPAFVAALQELVDAAADMEHAGLPAADLISSTYRKDIDKLKLSPLPRPRRFATVAELDASREEH